MEINELITRLKSFDLETCPHAEIKSLLKENIGKILTIQHTFHKGMEFMRGRINEEYDIRYTKKIELSYKPQQYNKTYQRASTPNNTMFYACYLSSDDSKIDSMRIPCIMESMYKEINDKNTSFYKKITLGRWKVIKDLNVIPLFLSDNLSEETSYMKEMKENYNTELSKINDKNFIEKSCKIQNYLANEFSKEDINGDYDYMISAIFSEIITELELDGVLYPSVRTNGQSFNIAITPKATEKLQLIAVGECSLYKHKEEVVVGNDASVELSGNEEEFELRQSDSFSDEQRYLIDNLGFDSFEDFKDYCDKGNNKHL